MVAHLHTNTKNRDDKPQRCGLSPLFLERAAQTLNGRAVRGVTDAHSRSRLPSAAGAHAHWPTSMSTQALLPFANICGGMPDCVVLQRRRKRRRACAPARKLLTRATAGHTAAVRCRFRICQARIRAWQQVVRWAEWKRRGYATNPLSLRALLLFLVCTLPAAGRRRR